MYIEAQTPFLLIVVKILFIQKNSKVMSPLCDLHGYQDKDVLIRLPGLKVSGSV